MKAALRVVAAGFLVASGLIHLRLWFLAYRHVKTLDNLFIVQVAATLLLAVVVLAYPRLLVLLAGIALLGGTIVGFILARTRGIFGFRLPFSSGLANWALVVEVGGIVVLAAMGWLRLRESA